MMAGTASHTEGDRMPRLAAFPSYFLTHLRKEMVRDIFRLGREISRRCCAMIYPDYESVRSEGLSEIGHKILVTVESSINHWVILPRSHITHGWFVQLALHGARGDRSPGLIFHRCQPGDVHLGFQSYSPGRRLSHKGGFFFFLISCSKVSLNSLLIKSVSFPGLYPSEFNSTCKIRRPQRDNGIIYWN